MNQRLYRKYFIANNDSHITVPVKLVNIHQELQQQRSQTSSNETNGDAVIDMEKGDERQTPPRSDESSESTALYTPPTSSSSPSSNSRSNHSSEGTPKEMTEMRQSKGGPLLNDLFEQELKHNQERDDLTLYENYIREQAMKARKMSLVLTRKQK